MLTSFLLCFSTNIFELLPWKMFILGKSKHLYLFFELLSICSRLSSVFTLISIKFFTKKILQKGSNLHEKCVMKWNERKINFPIFSFWVMVDFVLKNLRKFGTKKTKSQKLKMRKFIFYSLQHIPHLSCKFEHSWNFFVHG